MFPYMTSMGFQCTPTYARNAEYATQQIKFSKPQSNHLSPHVPKIFASVIIFCVRETHTSLGIISSYSVG